MKHITQAEYDELQRAKEFHDTFLQPGNKVAFIMMAQVLAASARKQGFILTIEQHSTFPPAMGAHEDVVTVRSARHHNVCDI